MRVSVQVADDIIVIDGKVKTVNCEALRKLRVSAIQWYGESGEIEFERHHKPNEIIKDAADLKALVEIAKDIQSPSPPTPAELDDMNRRYLLEHPDWRKPWDEYDAEMKRLHDEVAKRDPLQIAAQEAIKRGG